MNNDVVLCVFEKLFLKGIVMLNRREFIKNCSAFAFAPVICSDAISKELKQNSITPDAHFKPKVMWDLLSVAGYDHDHYSKVESKVPYHPAVGYYPFGLVDSSQKYRTTLDDACRIARMQRRYGIDEFYTFRDTGSPDIIHIVTDCGMTCNQCLGKRWRTHFAPCRQLTCPGQKIPATSICNAVRYSQCDPNIYGAYYSFNIQEQDRYYP
jgi:hypothetical protein